MNSILFVDNWNILSNIFTQLLLSNFKANILQLDILVILVVESSCLWKESFKQWWWTKRTITSCLKSLNTNSPWHWARHKNVVRSDWLMGSQHSSLNNLGITFLSYVPMFTILGVLIVMQWSHNYVCTMLYLLSDGKSRIQWTSSSLIKCLFLIKVYSMEGDAI